MDGKILGFDAAAGTGAIKAGDGSRYTFAAADWRGANPPKPGDDVDFEADGSVAKEIYPTKTGLNIDLSALGGAASGAASSGAGAAFLSSWAPILAVASLVLSLFPFMGANGQNENLFGVVEMAGTLKQMISGFSMMGQMGGMFGGGEVEVPAFVGILKFFLTFYPLFYLIPLAAIWVLVFTFMGKPLRLPSLVHGGLAVGLPVVLIFVAFLAVSMSMPSEMREMGGGGMGGGLQIGGWLIILVGLVQLAEVFGILKVTPAGLLNKK